MSKFTQGILATVAAIVLYLAVFACTLTLDNQKQTNQNNTNNTPHTGYDYSQWVSPEQTCIAPDGSFCVVLDGNDSTGYSWSYEMENNIVLYLDDCTYVHSDNTGMLVGAGGTYRWYFFGAVPGTTTVTFSYARAGEAPIETKAYQVQVDQDLRIAGFQLLDN